MRTAEHGHQNAMSDHWTVLRIAILAVLLIAFVVVCLFGPVRMSDWPMLWVIPGIHVVSAVVIWLVLNPGLIRGRAGRMRRAPAENPTSAASAEGARRNRYRPPDRTMWSKRR